MPKAKLEFKLPEEQEGFNDALNGSDYKVQLEDVWNNVFRPHYKHGYPDQELQQLIDDNYEVADKIIEKLSEIFISYTDYE